MRTYIVYYHDYIGRRCDLCELIAANAEDAKDKAKAMILDSDRAVLYARAAK